MVTIFLKNNCGCVVTFAWDGSFTILYLSVKILVTWRKKKVIGKNNQDNKLGYIDQCFIAKPEVVYNFIYKAFLFQAKDNATNK